MFTVRKPGIHSGPINEVTDVNDRLNIAGAGINVTNVMDCGDAGHILLSKHVADDFGPSIDHWAVFTGPGRMRRSMG